MAKTAYRDLREFMAVLEREGELLRIREPISAELEITEIADRVVKKGGPALLFESVEGSPYPVLINTFGSPRRMALALGGRTPDEVGQEMAALLAPPEAGGGFLGKLRALPKLAELSHIFPREVHRAPCQEVVEEPDLGRLPILKCWPQDGGRFITLPLVITRDPETGRQNMGMYRMQVFDEQTTGMHWHLHKDGAHHYGNAVRRGEQRIPVAVALGADPATLYASTAPLPRGIDELMFAGYLRGAPVEVVRATTSDLLVPAQAEFILEGYVDTAESRLEGPFGDHSGYYSLEEEFPVFHLTRITRRKQPIYPSIVVGRPPMEDTHIGKATERIFLPLLKIQYPEIVDMQFPLEGVFHNAVVVSIRKTYPGQAKKIMHSLWGFGQLMFSKTILVVDEDVNVQDMSEVWWRVFNNVDARRDVVIVEGPVDVLDHATPTPKLGGKMGIDATRKGPSENHPRPWPQDAVMDPAVREEVSRRFGHLGI